MYTIMYDLASTNTYPEKKRDNSIDVIDNASISLLPPPRSLIKGIASPAATGTRTARAGEAETIGSPIIRIIP